MANEQHRVRDWFKKLGRAPLHYFPPARQHLVAPDKHGVYVIYDPRKRVAHVGRSVKGSRGLSQRLNNHLNNASSFTLRYLDGHGARLRNGYSYRYICITSPRRRALVEAYALGYLCPLHLGHGDPKWKRARRKLAR